MSLFYGILVINPGPARRRSMKTMIGTDPRDAEAISTRGAITSGDTFQHAHPEAEMVVVISGRVLVLAGGPVQEGTPGDIFFIGSHLTHAVSADEGTSLFIVTFREEFLTGFFRLFGDFAPQADLAVLVGKGVRWQDAESARLIIRLADISGMEKLIALAGVFSRLTTLPHQLLSQLHTSGTQTNERADDKLAQIFAYTEAHYQEAISLAEIAAVVNFTETSFCRFFKKATGKKYYHYLNEVRINHACLLLLADRSRSIEEVCYLIGYSSPSTFYKHFKKMLHLTPTAYLRKADMSAVG